MRLNIFMVSLILCFCVSGLTTADDGNAIYFYNQMRNEESSGIWKSNGMDPGTIQIKVNNFTNPTGEYLSIDDTLYFAAKDESMGEGLWKSDDSDLPVLLKKGVWPENLTNIKGYLYFTVENETSGVSLWKSNGTERGTKQLKVLSKNSSISGNQFFAGNGSTFFYIHGVFNSEKNGRSWELWTSDGSTEGTLLLSEYNHKIAVPHMMDGALYFMTDSDPSGLELWKSDGTLEGTTVVKNILPGIKGTEGLTTITHINHTLYFSVRGKTHGISLWKSDGTFGGTLKIKDFTTQVNGFIGNFLTLNGSLYFTADDGLHGTELWKSDGTSENTLMVKDIFPGKKGLTGRPFKMGKMLYFSADDGKHGEELWRSDGTTEGTVMVKDIHSGKASGYGGSIDYNATVLNGAFYFTASNSDSGAELWKSNGTSEGTVMVKDIIPGKNASFPQNFIATDETVFFTARTENAGCELWKSDGTNKGTIMVKDISPGKAHSYLTGFIKAAD